MRDLLRTVTAFEKLLESGVTKKILSRIYQILIDSEQIEDWSHRAWYRNVAYELSDSQWILTSRAIRFPVILQYKNIITRFYIVGIGLQIRCRRFVLRYLLHVDDVVGTGLHFITYGGSVLKSKSTGKLWLMG